jgi:hypothetical protein
MKTSKEPPIIKQFMMKIMMNAHDEGNDGCTTSKSQG